MHRKIDINEMTRVLVQYEGIELQQLKWNKEEYRTIFLQKEDIYELAKKLKELDEENNE